MEPQPRAIRPPPSRRALFNSTSHNPSTHAPTRRVNPTSVRPDTANIFTQPQEDELVERDSQGEYVLNAPHPSYKHLALGLEQEVDEEAGTYIPHSHRMTEMGETERELTCKRVREANHRHVRQAECALGRCSGGRRDQSCAEEQPKEECGEY